MTVAPTNWGGSLSRENSSTVSVLDSPTMEPSIASFILRFLAILEDTPSEAIIGERRIDLEISWGNARTTLEHDVCVTSFFQTLWRDGGSLAYWEERGGLNA